MLNNSNSLMIAKVENTAIKRKSKVLIHSSLLRIASLKKTTVPAFTGVTKSVSTDGKAHVIMLAICSGSSSTYNLFAIYSDGEYGDSFSINRGTEPGKTGTLIQNVTDSGFTINLGTSQQVNSAICYYIT